MATAIRVIPTFYGKTAKSFESEAGLVSPTRCITM